MQRTWIVAGDGVGLTAPEREEFVARWDVYNDAGMAMLFGYPTSGTPDGVLLRPPVLREHREAVWETLVARSLLAFDVRATDDGRLLGEGSLSRITWPRASAEIALAIFDPEDRGRGLGTEAVTLMAAYAFDGLGLHRVAMRYLAMNEAVARAIERAAGSLGGRVVGVEREAEWAFGGWQDAVLVECLSTDFPPHPATAALRAAPGRVEVG
ncbi:MAG TPA: GNAT family protein [Thermoleophilaceae bacterium]|jgi:RimJ/RimL family protein N-acetyltransferase